VTVADQRPLLQHDAIFYDDESSLAAAAVSFVREGVERDEVVLVNTGHHPVTSLVSALFGDDRGVVLADRDVYSTPAGALEGYRRALDRGLAEGAKGFRAMGYIDFAGSRLPWQEWLRYEAAVNEVFADYRFRTLCPYDTTDVAPEVLEAVARAHTGLVGTDGRRPNPRYTEPMVLVDEAPLRTPPHPLQRTAPRMQIEPSHALDDLRVELYAATMFTDLPRVQVDDFVSAVTEIVHNAHKHGTEPVTLTLWASDTAVVSTVTDQGRGIADPFVGYARPTDPAEGLGLWGARQLVDVLDFERDENGFTVRAASFA
jgi:anti-sigma regulatory factor (Ser/Thr protein kinase)